AVDERPLNVQPRLGNHLDRFAEPDHQRLPRLIDRKESAVGDDSDNRQYDGGAAAEEAGLHWLPPCGAFSGLSAGRPPSGRYGTTPGPACGPVSMMVFSVEPKIRSMVSRYMRSRVTSGAF